jgi:hypothetical protein
MWSVHKKKMRSRNYNRSIIFHISFINMLQARKYNSAENIRDWERRGVRNRRNFFFCIDINDCSIGFSYEEIDFLETCIRPCTTVHVQFFAIIDPRLDPHLIKYFHILTIMSVLSRIVGPCSIIPPIPSNHCQNENKAIPPIELGVKRTTRKHEVSFKAIFKGHNSVPIFCDYYFTSCLFGHFYSYSSCYLITSLPYVFFD